MVLPLSSHYASEARIGAYTIKEALVSPASKIVLEDNEQIEDKDADEKYVAAGSCKVCIMFSVCYHCRHRYCIDCSHCGCEEEYHTDEEGGIDGDDYTDIEEYHTNKEGE